MAPPKVTGAGVSSDGALIALATGALGGLGYALLQDHDLKRTVKSSIGM